jgi:hypothetical protein
MQSKINEIKKGLKFNSLTLTGNHSFVDSKSGRRMVVEAECDCGVIKNYPYRFLTSGNTKSCGCVRKRKLLESKITHHLSKHPLYSVYQDMKRRCYDENCKSYKNYGGRGITICDEWLNNVKSFCDWGIKNGYEKGLEIDREENEGNYSPENCRFITRAVGNTNTRRVIKVTAFNETKTVAEWTRDIRCSVSKHALADRLKNGKWEVELAITSPPNDFKKEISRNSGSAKKVWAFGEEKSLIEWSEDKRCTVGYSGLKGRLKRGWSIEQAILIKLLP